MIALNSQEVTEKLGALWVFKSYLFENEEAQMAIATTLTPLPTTDEGDTHGSEEDAAIGRRLIHSLLDHIPEGRGKLFEIKHSVSRVLKYFYFISDPFRAWFAACMLSYILTDNIQCKELVLRYYSSLPSSLV